MNHLFIKNKKDTLKPKPPPSGGSSIALWEVVDHGVVSSRLCGDKAATGFWWSIRDYWWDCLRWCGFQTIKNPAGARSKGGCEKIDQASALMFMTVLVLTLWLSAIARMVFPAASSALMASRSIERPLPRPVILPAAFAAS